MQYTVTRVGEKKSRWIPRWAAMNPISRSRRRPENRSVQVMHFLLSVHMSGERSYASASEFRSRFGPERARGRLFPTIPLLSSFDQRARGLLRMIISRIAREVLASSILEGVDSGAIVSDEAGLGWEVWPRSRSTGMGSIVCPRTAPISASRRRYSHRKPY